MRRPSDLGEDGFRLQPPAMDVRSFSERVRVADGSTWLGMR